MKKTNKNLIKMISSILVCVLLFTSNIWVSAKTVSYENIKIDTIGDIDINYYENYIKSISSQPKVLTKNCSSIIFTDEDLNKKFDFSFDANVLAVSYGKTIYINGNDYNNIVMTHELCHVFDYSNNWISDSEEFTDLYKKYKDVISVSNGNVETSYEFFASVGEIYFTNTIKLNSIAPELFNYYENMFKK